EAEFAAWLGTKFALAYPSGTESIRAALWACGVGAGDDVISSSMVIWAGCSQALALGAAVHFADIQPDTLCLDPADLEHRIGPRTKAIVVVHYCGYPAEMDPILELARRYGIRVIEDVSHAHGGLYRGHAGRRRGHERHVGQGARARRGRHARHEPPHHPRACHLLRPLRTH